MFTGIIETVGKVDRIKETGNAREFEIRASFAGELKIGDSVAHNGVCLTVTYSSKDAYCVTVVPETLIKSNLGELKQGDFINLERAMAANARFDGHIVQGHIDETAICKSIDTDGKSMIFSFEYNDKSKNYTIEKGSITINGISLTVVNSKENSFSVAIIPHTLESTTLKKLKEGDKVNLEFDVLGKYLEKLFLKYLVKQ